MISGPAETGKTWACCQKLNALLWKYPGATGAVVRKTRQSMNGSVLATYKKVLGPDTPVRAYGGENPEWFDYPNGSRLYIGGMDNASKILSAERDFIYVNQAEELTLADWETLLTRASGRAANAPYPQLFGDCNPGPPTHWIKQRPSILLLESRHEDNPTLFDEQGQLTQRGARTLAILDSLTGVRYQRLRLGKWVAAEGMVYETFDRAVHLVDRFPIPSDWWRMRAIDFGYTNPFVCLWIAVDHDGRLYVYREIYMTGRTVEAHAAQIKALSEGERIRFTVADHDAEDRATLAAKGIPTLPANKAISPGIQAIQDRLKRAGDGKPRLFLLRDSLVEADQGLADARKPYCTEHEFDSYQWPKGQDGRAMKEVPVDLYNHGMDSLRYAVMAADQGVSLPAQQPANVSRWPVAPQGGSSRWRV